MKGILLRHAFVLLAVVVFAASFCVLWLVGAGYLSIQNGPVRVAAIPGYLVLLLTAFAATPIHSLLSRDGHWVVAILCQFALLLPFVWIDRMRDRHWMA